MKSFPRVLTLLLLATASVTRGFELQQFMQETQRINQGKEGVALVWWIPSVYWEQSLRQKQNITPKQVEEIVGALEPYTMFAVVKMEVGPFGTLKTKPRGELLDAFEIKFNGKLLEVAPESELSPEIKNLLAILKPVMSSMLGQMGQGLEFVIYPNTKMGAKIIDPRAEGTMEAKLFDSNFRWRLPLGALLPTRVDPKSGEEFPGNYSFNPFTGEKLKVKPPSGAELTR